MNQLPMAPFEQGVTSMVSRRQLLRLAGLSGVSLAAPGLLAACASSSGFSYAATIADARTAILKALDDTATPSISVALTDRNQLIWAEAFGVIDKTTHAAPTVDTLFCIGSCSKMIATIATMILVERGQLNLDQPLKRYLSGFRMAAPEFGQITPRMLLSHASGFPGSDYRGIFSTVARDGYATQVMQTLGMARLKHMPGEMSVYCNDGFTMIEPLVPALTGKTYAQFVTDEILLPLGMARSCFPLTPFADGSFAPGFSGGTKQPQEFTLAYASGGLYSTPTEMARLARMLLGGGQLEGKRILQPESVAEMARDQTLTQPLRPVIIADGFGLGWDGVRQGGLAAVGITAWHKNGGTSVYGSDFFVVPDEGLALMITGASTGYGSGVLAERILLNALLERSRISTLPPALPLTPGPEALASDAQLSQMEGVYAHYQGLLRLKVQADRTLSISKYAAGAWTASPASLKLRSDGTFSSDASPNNAYSTATSQGQSYLLARTPFGMGHYLFELPYAQKMRAKTALSAAWQARLGRKWLAVNDSFDSLGLVQGGVLFTLAGVPDLPGYVLASADPIDKHDQIADPSGSDSAALMCLKIPMAQGRDLDDVLIESHNGEEWVRVGSSLFRPLLGVPTLGIGAHALMMGAQGFAEWRQLPSTGAVKIGGVTAWMLYDQDLAFVRSGSGNGTSALPGRGSKAYLMLFAMANAGVDVTVT